MDEAGLRRVATQKLRDGELFRVQAVSAWAGPGMGRACDLCEQRISADQLEIEVEFEGADGPVGHRFHRVCHAMWELERARQPDALES